MPCYQPFRGDSAQLLLFKIASCLEASGAAGASVLSFNGRTGDVILSLADVAAVADGRYVLKAGDTMTGALVHPDGTAALPSITFTGDLDTGIYHPAANTVGIAAGGVLTLSVLTTGINIPSGLAYQYNSVNVIRAQTALTNYFFGPSGNLTMTGTGNISLGPSALVANTTGTNNTAIGTNALGSNTTGSSNLALGVNALFLNTTGGNNTAFGVSALLFNVSGMDNTALGKSALNVNTGSNNVAVGSLSLVLNTSGGTSTAVGVLSLTNQTTGVGNTAVGYAAGGGITTGSNNTILGANVTGLAAALSNNIIIADGAGNRRINVISSGFVGIGTTTPNTTLHVANSGGNQLVLEDTSAGADLKKWILNSESGTLRVKLSNDAFSGTQTFVTILSSGNVGIGTTSPSSSLTLATSFALAFNSGANTRAGNATLVGGTVTVANTTVTANTLVFVTRKTSGGTIGFSVTYTVIAATSFTLTSDNALDTSTYSYLLIENP